MRPRAPRPGDPPYIPSPQLFLLWFGPNALVLTLVLVLAKLLFGRVPGPAFLLSSVYLAAQLNPAFGQRREPNLDTARSFIRLAAAFGAIYALAVTSLCIFMR